MRRLGPRRAGEDRGAVGVMFALLLVPLLVCTALVVDIGSAYSARRMLQSASDAAALAIALDCANGNCGNINTTAATYTNANMRSGTASATPTISGNSVTVRTSSVVPYLFAPVIGIKSTVASAQSTAVWIAPTEGTASLPLAFSWCSFKSQTGGGLPTGSVTSTIYLPKTDNTGCSGPTGNPAPGGFGWLKTNPGTCTATSSTADAKTYSDPGRSVPSSCTVENFAEYQNDSVLLPIYDYAGGNGANAWYHIYAYAAFNITGYSFTGQYKWNAPCSGNDSCIRGYFLQYVEPAAASHFSCHASAPDLGARVITLTA